MPRRISTYKPIRLIDSRQQDYDRYGRDPEARRFYASAPWRKLRLMKLRRDPLCEACKALGLLTPATHVHHVIELHDDLSKGLDLANLESLCNSCHSRLHALGG